MGNTFNMIKTRLTELNRAQSPERPAMRRAPARHFTSCNTYPNARRLLVALLVLLGGSLASSPAQSVNATDGGTAIYGDCKGIAIDFDATVVPSAVWTPGLSAGQTYAVNSVSIRNAAGNTGNYYIGVYTSYSGGSLSGFKGVSDTANNFATAPNGWLTFTFSNINHVVTADSTPGSGSGLVYFVYQAGTSAVSSPTVSLGTYRFAADTYMTNSLAGIINFGGVVATRSPQYQATITPALPICVVNTTSTLQVIDGFGFSDGWSGTLSAAKNKALYETLGLTIFRAFVHMNPATDYNTPMANINAAHAAGALVFATGWADKSWTNSTGHMLPSRYEDYAIWLRDQAIAKNIDYISPFNEPDGNIATQVRWTPTQILHFIKTNAPTIGKPIIMPEAIGFSDAYSDPVLNDSVARSNIAIVAGHFYGNGNYVHANALNKGFPVWQTEHIVENSATDITAAMEFAKEVSDAMNHLFSAYCWWWVNDNVSDGSNLVLNNGTIFKNGYVLGQFARWVRPGMVRCSATYNPASGIFVTAYRGDTNGIVIVAVNTNPTATSLDFMTQNGTNISRFAAYRTSASEGMANIAAAVVTNNSFSYTLPGQSVTTFVQFFGSLPNAPEGLNVTLQSNGRPSLTWNAVTNAASYNVKRSLTNGGPYTIIASGVTATNFPDTDYSPQTTYYYVVSAVNGGGESPDSLQVGITTTAIMIAAPLADAYVRNGGYTNMNFGSDANLTVKTDNGVTDATRISYLKFNVAGLSNVLSAKLADPEPGGRRLQPALRDLEQRRLGGEHDHLEQPAGGHGDDDHEHEQLYAVDAGERGRDRGGEGAGDERRRADAAVDEDRVGFHPH
jgi:glucuronoarabinoxylan endo-1,4-beta-xylanase